MSTPNCRECEKPLCVGQTGGVCSVPFGVEITDQCHGHAAQNEPTSGEIMRYTWDQNEDTGYETLKRPDGSGVACIGEPEDRTFGRDLSLVIEELDDHLTTIAALRAENKRLTDELERNRWATKIIGDVSRENMDMAQDRDAQLGAAMDENARLTRLYAHGISGVLMDSGEPVPDLDEHVELWAALVRYIERLTAERDAAQAEATEMRREIGILAEAAANLHASRYRDGWEAGMTEDDAASDAMHILHRHGIDVQKRRAMWRGERKDDVSDDGWPDGMFNSRSAAAAALAAAVAKIDGGAE